MTPTIFIILCVLICTVESDKQKLVCKMKSMDGVDSIGFVRIVEKRDDNGTATSLSIKVKLNDNGKDIIKVGYHGLHVHKDGDCNKPGAHYSDASDDAAKVHGSIFGDENGNSEKRHTGDLGNFLAGKGQISQKIFLKLGDDFPSPLGNLDNLYGKSMILKEKEDDLGRQDNEASSKNGNAGLRIACCSFDESPILPHESPIVDDEQEEVDDTVVVNETAARKTHKGH